MTIEMSLVEAEILIAILLGAEVSFAITNPPLAEALKALGPWRTALLRAYVSARINPLTSHEPSIL